ncbi:YhgE/Pip domain-containing protein [Aeromicrobium fastidiosum]|uniref:YhgE/Pip domain-containing protein n=1 Tax=Aeromicrobium fastidiosum TaxID=52699 RepID=A0A641AP85_9ACTN|nr:YhgE/Pip domain-containing protein [Aeromicrobium fastidiosum]KAA1376449.1 YhgE/Pip domain-containing protein [Aeromicrobium fastidiosum]MBP2391636.1 putative membrane protein [Aeromicrobium fastidiosum]
MIPSPTLPWFELARFRRSRLTRAAVIAVMLVPLFYGAMYVWANLDPTGRLDHVKAAVVNEDQLVEIEGTDGAKQPVAIGRQLAGNLVSNDDDTNYDWVLTDAADARRGLADGDYKAVLTIPENLSAAATSTSGDPAQAVQGRLDLQTNDAVNYINGTIAQTILRAAKGALNAQVTETYLDNVYLSFSDIKGSLTDAAGGASDLADGADQLGVGARKLANGADDLADGASTLADGADDLAAGNRRLADGADEVDRGARTLSDGLGQLQSRTATLPRDTQRLADGSRQVADGTAQVDRLVQGVTSGILGATDGADADIDRLATTLRGLADDCRTDPPPGLDCAAIESAAGRAGDLKTFVRDVRGQATGASQQTRQLADGARQVADGNAELARNVPALVGAIGQARDGAKQLTDGTSQLRKGADAAAAGASRLSGGADQLAAGSTRLADGGDRLVDGAGELSAGARKLADGLRDGSDKVPDYDKAERDRLATTAATPIEDVADRVNPVDNYGAALAPYFISLALWVGAMAIYLLLRPISARAIASTTGSIRVALAGYAPGLAVSVVQVVLLLAVLQGVLGVRPANELLLIGIALATAAVFTAINQMFVALFGGAGRFAALVFVSLQLTSAGGTYPIETAPRFFNLLHDLLPMTYTVHGLRAALAGGTDGVVRDFVVLGVFTALALGVTVIAARRRQTVTLARLHPTLQV